MSREKIKVIQYGLGPIGTECAKWCLRKPGLELIGAVDIDPEKAGKPLEEVLGIQESTGITVSKNLEQCLKKGKPEVALHTTQSSLKAVFPQLEQLLKAGINVVSSTEELLVPELQNPELTSRLDQMASENQVTVLGTGVNPGFVMDTLPLCLSSMCLEIKSIRVRRELDAGKRRLPLQKKVGSTLSVEEFNTLKKEKKIGHVGLVESMVLLLKGLGWRPDEVIETLDAMVAEQDLRTEFLTIRKGEVCGIKHIARALKGGKEIAAIDLRMYVGAPESFDLVEIEGTPPIKMKCIGGIHGDRATVAALVNAVPRVLEAASGVKTMSDLKLPAAFDAIHP